MKRKLVSKSDGRVWISESTFRNVAVNGVEHAMVYPDGNPTEIHYIPINSLVELLVSEETSDSRTQLNG